MMQILEPLLHVEDFFGPSVKVRGKGDFALWHWHEKDSSLLILLQDDPILFRLFQALH